jgi:tRNA (adenine22-N1)-methyltransferase
MNTDMTDWQDIYFMVQENRKSENGNVQLSARLQAVADLVSEGGRVADIGTDHGFVPIYLIRSQKASACIAMDVRKGPLERAEAHIRENGLADVIKTRISDGLSALHPKEADTIICAGMGGRLMQRILQEKDPAELGIHEMVLQPQSELMEFRRYLRECGYVFLEEEMISEEGKYYPMMKVEIMPEKQCDPYGDFPEELAGVTGCSKEEALRVCDRFGALLLRKRVSALYHYLLHGDEVCDTILAKLCEQTHPDRYEELAMEKEDIQTALVWYGNGEVR